MPVVVDSLRRINAVYHVTSREFSYNFLLQEIKGNENIPSLIIYYLRESKRIFNCWVACSFKESYMGVGGSW